MSGEIGYTDILGVHISALNMPLAVKTIEDWIDHRERQYVCICTVHSVMEATRDPEYMEILNHAGMSTPDGMPLVWVSRRAGNKHVDRVAGPDLLPELASRSAITGHRHYFYGGGAGIAETLAGQLVSRYPGLQVAGTFTPDMQPIGAIESDEVIGRINASNAEIVWVGLGAPKQDFWVRNHRDLLDAPVLIAVGAAFDFHSGRIRRAPKWMQHRGLEWIYRLSQDPRRLWKRYLLTNSQFLVAMLKSVSRR